jgi:hypothetical protein
MWKNRIDHGDDTRFTPCHPSDFMDFDQGQFNFEAKGSEDGFRKWREELDAKKREFENRWGVILSKTVTVSLVNHAKPITGILEWVKAPKGKKEDVPRFRIRSLEFTPSEIESITQTESA